jgi:hypothetical protein
MSLPDLLVEQLSAEALGERWRIVWRIRNRGVDPLAVTSAWLPHGRFRSPEWRLEPPLSLPPDGQAILPSEVAWREPPGTVVENGFLILRLERWRAFARLTITAGPSAEPQAVCEAVTVQGAG